MLLPRRPPRWLHGAVLSHVGAASEPPARASNPRYVGNEGGGGASFPLIFICNLKKMISFFTHIVLMI